MRSDENVVARVHGNAPYKVIFISENLKSFASETGILGFEIQNSA